VASTEKMPVRGKMCFDLDPKYTMISKPDHNPSNVRSWDESTGLSSQFDLSQVAKTNTTGGPAKPLDESYVSPAKRRRLSYRSFRSPLPQQSSACIKCRIFKQRVGIQEFASIFPVSKISTKANSDHSARLTEMVRVPCATRVTLESFLQN